MIRTLIIPTHIKLASTNDAHRPSQPAKKNIHRNICGICFCPASIFPSLSGDIHFLYQITLYNLRLCWQNAVMHSSPKYETRKQLNNTIPRRNLIQLRSIRVQNQGYCSRTVRGLEKELRLLSCCRCSWCCEWVSRPRRQGTRRRIRCESPYAFLGISRLQHVPKNHASMAFYREMKLISMQKEVDIAGISSRSLSTEMREKKFTEMLQVL